MTRNNQILRAWLSKRKAHGTWISNVSFHGRVSSHDTRSSLRAAAVEYNHLHIRQILATPTSPAASGHQPHDHDLIHF